jgi:hypothetical protein
LQGSFGETFEGGYGDFDQGFGQSMSMDTTQPVLDSTSYAETNTPAASAEIPAADQETEPQQHYAQKALPNYSRPAVQDDEDDGGQLQEQVDMDTYNAPPGDEEEAQDQIVDEEPPDIS